MKIKYLLIFGFIVTLFFSCEPNKDLYEELDAAKLPYNEQISYTLTDDDYTMIKSLALSNAENAEDSAIANDVATYKSFSPNRKAAELIPAFLDASFIALDSSSAAIVAYNYLNTFEVENASVGANIYDSAEVVATVISIPDAEEGDIVFVQYNSTSGIQSDFFQFDGTDWFYPVAVSLLTNADYEAMGAPGAEHMFSSSAPAEDFIPTYLSLNFPYADVKQVEQVIYRYSNKNMSDYYVFDGQTWSNTEVKADQFVQIGTGWVFDPTVKYEMNNSDYQLIVDWVANNDTINNYVDETYDNTEYYFGASSYYGNFDMRSYKRLDNDPNSYLTGLTDEEALVVLYDRLPLAIQIFVEAKYPDAVPFVYGVPVYYEITFTTYDPPRRKYMIKFLCTDVGTFEYVEGPTLVE